MKIVVPYPIQTVAAFAGWPCHLCFLQVVFGDQDDGTRPGSLPRGATDCANNVFFGVIANGVRSVEPKTIEMKFLDPIARSEEHTSELQSPYDLVCRLLLE